MAIPLYVAITLSDSLDIDVVLLGCHVLIEGRELLADLVLLDVMDFDVILGMDWLSQHFATVDCRRKEVIFRIPNDEEFKFVGDKNSAPQNLISAITARKMLRKGCQGYIAVVRDTTAEKTSVSDVLVACEFPDIYIHFFFLMSCQIYHLIERLSSILMLSQTQLLFLYCLIGWLL